MLARTNTIAHEMAHMWFGDLVTMQWWDDLWLNESFAEYMAHRTCVDGHRVHRRVGRLDDGPQGAGGMPRSAPPRPTRWPGRAALDAQAALQDFDGISYAKGAATLRQLIAHIGDDAFIAGVAAYLRAALLRQRHAGRLHGLHGAGQSASRSTDVEPGRGCSRPAST